MVMSALNASLENENSNDEEEFATRTASTSDPIQLYRPAISCKEVEMLLTRPDLSEEDIAAFLSGGDLPASSGSDSDDDDVRTKMRLDFYQRRSEIRALAEKLKRGEARVDEDGRLVPSEPARPPRANLPPPPPPGRNNNNNNNLNGPVVDADNPAVNGILGPGPNIFQGRIEDQAQGEGAANLTFRRICFAVLAVVGAFIVVILQTLPLMQPSEAMDPNFDNLLHDLLHVKFLKDHLRYCPDLHRHPPLLQPVGIQNFQSYQFWQERVRNLLGLYSESNCDDGVLHIPAKHVISNTILHSSSEEGALLAPLRDGVDKIWNIPCLDPHNSDSTAGDNVSPISRCYPGWNNDPPSYRNDAENEYSSLDRTASSRNKCFRGVHDDVISKYEVEETLRLGNFLILNGGDHFDLHYDVSYLLQRIPTVVTKLQRLLHERYNQSQLQPVAFRIQTAGPMDFYGVNLFQTSALTLNQTVSLF